MGFRPLLDRVLVKPIRGVVVAAGPGKRNAAGKILEMGVSTGDTVVYGKWSGTEVKIDGEDHIILSEGDILGVVP